MASVNRVHSYTQSFIELGVETRVIIPVATIPYDEKNITQNKIGEGFYKGVYFKYMSGIPLRSKNKWKRPIFDFFSRFKTIRYLLKECDKDTVLYVWAGGFCWYSLLIFIGHIRGAKIFTELNELPYGTGRESKKTKLYRTVMLNFVFPHFDGIICISETLQNLVRRYNHKECNTLKVPILVDANINNSEVKQLAIKEPFIFHAGTLQEQKDGVVMMLKAFAKAKRHVPDLKFFLTGNPNKSIDKDAIYHTISTNKLENDVVFLGYLDDEILKSYEKSCSLMIICKYDTLQNKYCFSTKLGEYLAFGKPVIITNIGEAVCYLKDGENAIVVDWRMLDDMADAICRLLSDKEFASHIGINGRNTCIEEFNYLKHGKRMIEYFKSKLQKQ